MSDIGRFDERKKNGKREKIKVAKFLGFSLKSFAEDGDRGMLRKRLAVGQINFKKDKELMEILKKFF